MGDGFSHLSYRSLGLALLLGMDCPSCLGCIHKDPKNLIRESNLKDSHNRWNVGSYQKSSSMIVAKCLFWQALTFNNCKDLVVKNLKIKNAQKQHVSFEKCVGVQASRLKITAPEDSPNTDGIHVTHSQNIQISSSVIATGTLKTYPKTKLKIFSFLKKEINK